MTRRLKKELKSAAAEAPATLCVLLERRPEVVDAELRPERLDEDELRVGGLPEQEVREPELARRPDQQIRVRHLGRVQVRRDERLVDLVRGDAGLDDPPQRLDDLRASAVVERDPEQEPAVRRGLPLERLHPLLQLLRRAVAPTDEPRAHALPLQIRELALD